MVQKMNEELYEIYDEKNNLIGSYLTRDTALLLMDALFVKYYQEINLSLTMKRMIFEVQSNE